MIRVPIAQEAKDDFKWLIQKYFHDKEVIPPVGVIKSVNKAFDALAALEHVEDEDEITYEELCEVKNHMERILRAKRDKEIEELKDRIEQLEDELGCTTTEEEQD